MEMDGGSTYIEESKRSNSSDLIPHDGMLVLMPSSDSSVLACIGSEPSPARRSM